MQLNFYTFHLSIIDAHGDKNVSTSSGLSVLTMASKAYPNLIYNKFLFENVSRFLIC